MRAAVGQTVSFAKMKSTDHPKNKAAYSSDFCILIKVEFKACRELDQKTAIYLNQ
jgi:hypothetical protein